ncbi:MAG: glycosyltransferase [Chlorobi bacterium]|nr:glycosyltransferase [Chlorobiota bacterium]MBX7216024.1 glycosyltransferase [Candidatus Kapabacteria bacterium]
MLLFYRYLVRPLLDFLLRAMAVRSRKARLTWRGRKEWRTQLRHVPQTASHRVHFHAASVGEFEQAKPIIEAIRATFPGSVITASFFSSSGMWQQGNYDGVDAACHLPPDRPKEINEFLDHLRPQLIIIIRYDLWPQLLAQANRRKIPVVLACGVLHGGSARLFPVVRRFFRWLYGQLTLACVVGPEDERAFRQLAPTLAVRVAGDTRYDRVVARTQQPSATPVLAAHLPGSVTLIAGSTWPDDERLLAEATAAEASRLQPILVPHEPTPQHLDPLRKQFPNAVLLSELEKIEIGGSEFEESESGKSEPEGAATGKERGVIVDRTGMLSGLYRQGEIAYVGGGFGAGVHSVLEPAAYGIPVICGPGIHRSRDAVAMEKAGALIVVADAASLRQTLLRLLDNPEERNRLGTAARQFVEERANATERIISTLLEKGLLA